MNKFIKVFSIFTLIWSSIAIINGLLLFICFILDAINLIYGLNRSGIFDLLILIEAILTVGMITFICFLQSLWVYRQLKNRN